jgi:hypothetical protein
VVKPSQLGFVLELMLAVNADNGWLIDVVLVAVQPLPSVTVTV